MHHLIALLLCNPRMFWMLGNWLSWYFIMISLWEECAAGWTPLLWEERSVKILIKVFMSSYFFQLYIMTLGCLAPYRRLGIGTKMLEHVLKVVQEDGNFASIFLHVQINNQSAIEFYKKFGFNIVETKEQYYKVT